MLPRIRGWSRSVGFARDRTASAAAGRRRPGRLGVGLGCMSASWGYYLDPQDDAVSERTLRSARSSWA